ncbi:ATP-binding protein [Streptomyces sp. NBC_00441]|uniref:ATP-binding protein n=1 Tax=Streptomyces sp. NBC_00441 TaxID=2975742 RepID=UPI002E2C1967|nr:ATP-binding protein [Streptomyces sp. NBC_00441]
MHDDLSAAEFGEGSDGIPDGFGISLVPESAAAARDAVTELLTTQFCALVGAEMTADVVVADALLVTSELVTNAVLHGGGVTGFAAGLTGDGLRITVSDASSDLPAVEAGAVGWAGGYGWTLVCRLAERVAIDVGPRGKSITALVAMA